MSSFQGRFAALTASQVEDLGLQAILEKMNSLITPLVKGPFWNISKFFSNILENFAKFIPRRKSMEIKLSTLKELIIDPPHRLINYGGARLINSEGSAY